MGTTNSAGKRLRAKWDAGEAAFGMWAGIPTSFTAELGAEAEKAQRDLSIVERAAADYDRAKSE